MNYCKDIEEIFKPRFPNIIVKYWGLDPDDLDMGAEDDGYSGLYNAYMASVSIEELLSCEYLNWLHSECKRLFIPCDLMISFHDEATTKEYYPKIYKEYLDRARLPEG